MESVLRALASEPRSQQVLAWQAAKSGRKLPPALQQMELALARAIYPSLPAAASSGSGPTPSRLAHAVKPLPLHVDKAYASALYQHIPMLEMLYCLFYRLIALFLDYIEMYSYKSLVSHQSSECHHLA